MLTFKKSKTRSVQMFESSNGLFIVREKNTGGWLTVLVTRNMKEAENMFYWLILIYTNQVKYIQS